jgi:epoxyqueuosine reductase
MNDLRQHIKDCGIDVCGFVHLESLQDMPTGLPAQGMSFLKDFPWAVVLGAQQGKLGRYIPGMDVSLFLEKAALEAMGFMEERGYRALIIHTEDEFDPTHRMGLLSLKVLAKAAGLGWQGRSLLIVSPEHGPLHRLIAVLTNMPLEPDQPIPNQCGDCILCVEKCPQGALTVSIFEDHPGSREEVLDTEACKGDAGCKVCMVVCPYRDWPREYTLH